MIYYYKLCCKDLNIKEIYIGSTKQPLRKRFYEHKKSCNNINRKSYNFNVYQYIRENGGIENWTIIEIERIDEEMDNQQLFKRERFWLEELKATLNSNIPSRSIKEYYKDNREEIAEKMKEYRYINKDKIKEYEKQYRLDNKAKILECHKQYRENNKQKINEKQNEKVECKICNKFMNKSSLYKHNKTFH